MLKNAKSKHFLAFHNHGLLLI